MINNKLKGVIPAILTSFDENDNIYEKGIFNQIDYLKNNNIESIFIGGSYGSFALMNISEREKLIKCSLLKANEYGMKTIVQVGFPSTKDTIELAKFAENEGASIISSVVPYYYSGSILSEGDILRHFENLCGSIKIPVHCYNNPKNTGFDISPEFFKKLLNTGLLGIKDGGGSIERLAQILRLVKESKLSIDYIAGSTSLLLVSVVSGANGCVSGVSLVDPNLLINFFEACYEKRIDDALILQDKVLDIRNILQRYGPRAISCYDVLNHKGIDVGTCRLPWRRLSSNYSKNLISDLNKIIGI